MNRSMINRQALADPSWWHWAATVLLLGSHLLGVRGAVEAALTLCAVMAGYYLLRTRRWRPLPVQVRLVYLAWLSLGLLLGANWMHAVALAGTSAMAIFGYCPLVRTLGLLPFNRSEPFGLRLVWRQIVAAPAGGLFDLRRRPTEPAFAACSLASRPIPETFAPMIR
jgi:hypothetical protein